MGDQEGLMTYYLCPHNAAWGRASTWADLLWMKPSPLITVLLPDNVRTWALSVCSSLQGIPWWEQRLHTVDLQ